MKRSRFTKAVCIAVSMAMAIQACGAGAASIARSFLEASPSSPQPASINTEGEIWSHDGNGNATAHGYFKAGLASGSETKSYTYDAANRLTLVNYGGGMTNVSFDYDDADRKVEMIDGTGTTEWEYTDGDLTKMISPQGTIEYDYDGNARLEYLTEVIPGGSDIVTTYVYDDAGRTSTIDKFGETTTFVYDDASRPEKMIYDTGAYAKYSYDGRSRITAVEHSNSSDSLLRKETNVYDAASRITSRYEGPAAGGITTTFGYDDVGQLTGESSTGYSASYTYDANGNRATRTVNGVTETYTVDNADKLTSVTWSNGIVNYSKEYAYHYSGRPTSITYKTNGVTQATESMTWDKESRMLTNSLANASYVYNGFDTRTSKTVGSNTTTFKRAGAGAVAPVVSDISGSTTTNYLPGISSRTGSTSTFNHSGIKNRTLQTNSSQTNTATKRYDAFGNELSTTGTWQTQFDYGGGFGYQRDYESGYKLLGHRYYDPSTGRFLTRDPTNDGRNWYSYCGNNPISRADGNGQFWDYVTDGIGIVWDVVEFVRDPSWENAGWLLGDLVIGAIPFVPNTKLLRAGKEALEAGARWGGKISLARMGSCFVAGTQIAMADGTTKAIEEVEIGDDVLSRNQDNDPRSTAVSAEVAQTFKGESASTLLILLKDGSKVETTSDHWFYVIGQGFVPASTLVPNDRIAVAKGSFAEVASTKEISKAEIVYNFEVIGTHTYFVKTGDRELWVHNLPCSLRPSIIPDNWLSMPAKRGGGTKYFDPLDPAYTHVRIDPPGPMGPKHVHITKGGRQIGREGRDVSGALMDHPARHVPWEEWTTWGTWWAP